MTQVFMKFIIKLVSWSASATSRGVAPLDHEIGDDPVKG